MQWSRINFCLCVAAWFFLLCVEGYHGLPPRTGTLPDISSFDHEFFKLNRKQTDKMEPLLRLLLETTQEALMDAKLPIAELRGSNTGV